MASRQKPQRQDKPPDDFELERRRRERATIEEMAANQRLRPEPTRFAREVDPKLGAMLANYQSREDKRLADEQAGRQTKPFARMNSFEVILAMASYPYPEDYPAGLETKIQRWVNRPLPKLTEEEQTGLLEIRNLRQKIDAGLGEKWMLERLYELAMSPSEKLAVEAGTLLLNTMHPIEELKPTREPPKKKTRSKAN